MLADLTDEDGALAEIQDIEDVGHGGFRTRLMDVGKNSFNRESDIPDELEQKSLSGENLLDNVSREKLPPLYSGEEKGLDAVAPVKFFTPDSNWSWFASEFDGDRLFFGLVMDLRWNLDILT